MKKEQAQRVQPSPTVDRWECFSTSAGRIGVSGTLLDPASGQHNKQVSFYPIIVASDGKTFRYEDSTFHLGKAWK